MTTVRCFLVLPALLVLAVPFSARAQTRGFLVRLGADTVTVERFVRTGDRIEGTIVRHIPATSLLKYTLVLNKDGTVASYEQANVRADGSPLPNAATGQKMTFEGDSVSRAQTLANGQAFARKSVAPKGTLPAMPGSWLFYEMGIQAAKKSGAGAFRTFGFGAQQDTAGRVELRFIGADSAEMVQAGFRTGFRFNSNGLLTRGDASLTTQKFLVTPIRDADVAAIANAWAAKDAAGQGSGALSTRDTLNAEIGGAKITIDYGRPAKRGREIWGKLVPFDTTWRMGANQATQLKTDKDLEIGGVTVPAGTYTIWLLPSAGPSFMLVNKLTVDTRGAPLWGTMWDPKQDIAKIPLEKHMGLPTSEERFHIFVQGDMLMMHWDNGGYGVKVRAK